ncbi:putative phage abortive infection protein [Rhizobium leguminosarum]|uniref:putative phage abortive infection protein n=1 Tax=Rhizobium leguminosarum TaxID=384 RepID=UPI001CDC16FF|nr:putative phage abortive infection protein [Rhizobium leguminosarum]MCA2411242.1 putative phage abortive infection protein [Rhizobium leguminosarum]
MNQLDRISERIMRFAIWILGLATLVGCAAFFRPAAGLGVELVLTTGVLAVVWSIALWTSKVVDRIVEPSRGDSRGVFAFLLVLAFLSMGAVFIVGVHSQWAEKNLGTFGDFLGGVLNPVLTFLSFMALLFTIILQQREIHAGKKTAEDLQEERRGDRLVSERMQFENTFFQMVAIHNTIVNSIDVDRGPSKSQLRGRECFKYFCDQMLASYNSNSSADELQKSLTAHNDLWKSYQNDLAHYYRYLYNIIRFINESNVNKIRYIRILRAQLSDFELLVLFYNGLFPLATKFKAYVEFFTLFDNLPKDLLFNRSHEDFYDASAFDEKAPKKPLPFADNP